MNKVFGFALVLAIGSVSQAQQASDFRSDAEMKNYLTVSKVRIEEVPVQLRQSSEFDAPATPVSGAIALGQDFISSLGPVLLDPSGIAGWIAFGKKAWEVVVANRPVVNIASSPKINILPNDKAAWAQMSNWRGPVAKSFKVVATNLFGNEVVSQTYTVAYNYGGNYNGKGAYLANASIIPSNVSVLWGYTLDSGVNVGQILNMGAADAPVPGVDMQVKWKIATILKEEQTTESFFVQGNGALKHLTK